MTPDLNPWVVVASVIFGSGGAAWTAVRVALNGTRESVTRIESKVDKVVDKVSDHGERLARLEEHV